VLSERAMRLLSPPLDPGLVAEAADRLQQTVDALAALPDPPPEDPPAFRFDPVTTAGGPAPLPPPPLRVPDPDPAPPAEVAADLAFWPLWLLAEAIRGGRLTAGAAVEAYAARIERHAHLNAFITLRLEAARREALSPAPGRLSGVPVGLKDIIATRGVRTTGGSALLADWLPPEDATSWQRLAREGAILLGKLNTHEFAAGATGENRHYGAVRNPYDPTRMAGGSSSGSAAAVAAGLVAGALGSDTGGSIRIPAALCGVVGLKPTYGRVPVDGVLPLSWSLDHVGPITRTVRDAARLLDVMAPAAGRSSEDAARAGAASGLDGWRIGIPTPWLAGGMEEGVRDAFDAALAALRQLGAEVVAVDPGVSADHLAAANRGLAFAEASAWHERFLNAGRAGEYGDNVRPRKEAGRLVPADTYLTAQRLRTALCRAFAPVWRQVHLLCLPTVPITAPPLGTDRVQVASRTLSVTQALIGWASILNVLGTPALTLPCGFDADHLPVGLEFVAPPGEDGRVLYAGAAFEAATPHHRQRPNLAV
jgi:aspartyl-tRNA(Asn)/glutamyl-tRNA(Gln) amidotransferase subunit A